MTELAVSSRLEELEGVVRNGLARFMQVGDALLEIRDQRLYRERGYERFEDYCGDHFGLKRSRAYDLIEAARAVNVMSEISDITPPSIESHAREMAPLVKQDPVKAAEVWQAVHEETGGHPTRDDIRAALRLVRNNDAAEADERKEESGTPVLRVDKSREATEKRYEQVRGMVSEGYLDSQIAEAVGVTPKGVKLIVRKLGLPHQTDRVGRMGHQIDHDRALDALIEACTPTPEVLGVIDLSRVDPSRLSEWDQRLTEAIQVLTKLRTQLRKIAESSNGH